MRDLSDIQQQVETALRDFESAFQAMMVSGPLSPEMSSRGMYVSGGKHLRPMLVFLCAKLFGDINESTHRSALFVETLHTATLIHDDIVDGSEERRGAPALHVLLDTPTAVLTGDFLLAKSMVLLSNEEDLPLLQEMLTTILAMSEGEMMQRKRQKTEVRSREGYLEVIERKTAMLFRSCCVVGAMSAQAPAEAIPLVAEFGLNMGLVFQMRDDLLDKDDPESVAFAEVMLPQYLDKAQEPLHLLDSKIKDRESLNALKDLLFFCAQRSL